MDSRYVTREFEALTGDAAETQLRIRNDGGFLSAENGIIKISRERWELAQDAERHGWMDLWAQANQDRNQHHFALFDYFAMLQGHRFRRAIELGCGPFTNMQFIAATLEIDQVDLLDPLIQSYLAHQHCTYKDGSQIGLVDGRMQPVARLLAMPIEDLGAEPVYDLLVLINVIEHCIDVEKVFQNVWNMLSPGGVFIFHDKYFYHHDVASRASADFDTAHPLKVDRGFIDAFLGRFKPVFWRHTSTSGAALMTGDAVYFIGQRP